MRFALALVMLLALAGCGALSAPQGATTVPVKGKVTHNGKPLTKGVINFQPEGAGKDATGEIQPDGTFVLTTYKKDDGAVVGTITGIEANHGVAVAPDGSRIYVSNEAESTLDVADSVTFKVIAHVKLSGHPNNIAVGRDGRRPPYRPRRGRRPRARSGRPPP